MRKIAYLAFILILVSLALRLYGLNDPFGGVGGTATGNYMMIAKNYDIYGWMTPVNSESIQHLIVPPLYSWVLKIFLFLGESELIARLPSAIFGIASIAVMYFLTREFYEKKTAIISAAIFSVIPVHIMVSKDVIADIQMIFFMLLTTCFFVRYCNTDKRKYLYLSSASMALALLTKQPVVAIFIPFAYVLWSKRRIDRHAIMAFFISLVPVGIVFSIYPSFISHFFSAVAGEAYEVFFPFKVAYTFVYSFSPFVLVLSMLGLFYAIRNWNWKNGFWALWFVIYAVFFILRMPPDHAYYALPLVPAAAVLSGIASSQIMERINLNDSFIKLSFYVFTSIITASIVISAVFVVQITHFRDNRFVDLGNYMNTITTNNTRIAIMNDGGSVPLMTYYLDRSIINTNRTSPVFLRPGKEPALFYQYGKLKEEDMDTDAEILITSYQGMPEFLSKWLKDKELIKEIEGPEISMLMFSAKTQSILVFRL